MPNLAALFGGKGLGATPAVPVLSYTAEKQFTITNYDSTLTYTLSGCTRSGSVITVTTTGVTATVTAKYGRGVLSSAATQMLTAAHGRVLTTVYSGPHSSAGCGPRGDYCCGGGAIQTTAGNTCGGAPGTQGDFCGGGCTDPPCYGFFNIYCYNYYWTDYSGSGYTQQGNVWGKAA